MLAAVIPFAFGMTVFSPTTHLVVYRKLHWQVMTDLATLVAFGGVFYMAMRLGWPAWAAVAGASTAMLISYCGRAALHLYAARLAKRDQAERNP